MHATLTGPCPLKVVPAMAGAKGRGVFAAADIESGETIETAACIELDRRACDQIAGAQIDDYYFHHPGNEDGGLLVLGLASLCNHSDDPNAATQYDHEPGLGWLVRLTAVRRIRTGEELTRRYACAPWFAPSD